ncbi:hypothetical protein E4U55_003366 [Claviceps digitariae]|nr:hypothetical protein E4U55_003366 [Claviceps digitariae]
MAWANPAPPLLLTKRLSAFLHDNQIPELPTLLITSYHGKILSHASPNPISILRIHATVAASLVAIHASSSADISYALPGSGTPEPISSSPVPGADNNNDNPGAPEDSASKKPVARKITGPSVRPAAITVQFSGGTVIIRRLKCGLLLVCVGPSAQPVQPESQSQQQEENAEGNAENAENDVENAKDDVENAENVDNGGNVEDVENASSVENTGKVENADQIDAVENTSNVENADTADKAESADEVENTGKVENADNVENTENIENTGKIENADKADKAGNVENADPPVDVSGSPGEVESLVNAESQDATPSSDSVAAPSIAEMRRHAGDLACWLDEQLATLYVPEEFSGTIN